LKLHRIYLFLLAISLSVFPAHGDVISIRADYWYPMNGDPQSDRPGYMVELAQAIFEPHGIKVDYQLMPWSRAIQETRIGKVDCVIGAYRVSVPDFLFADEHWGNDETFFYKLKSDPWFYHGDLQELQNRKIGVISDYSYGETLDGVFAALPVQGAKGDKALETNIKKILSKRIDTMIESHYVMLSKLAQLNLADDIVSAGNTLQGEPMYLACHPNAARTKRYVDLVNREMPKMKKSGELKRILKKYNIEIW
jgi:polar amino acid transport system substrate-binding protein